MDVIAHRGFSSDYTENTLTAFAQALLLEVDAIELDIHQVENEFIVFHDFYVDKLTNGKGRITDFTVAELKQLRVKEIDLIPTLADVISLVGKQVTLNLEIKSLHSSADFAAYLLPLLDHFQCSVVLSSFDHPLLIECKQTLSHRLEIKYAALIAHSPIDHSTYAHNMMVDIAAIDCESVSAAFVANAHQYGLKVWCYTVNQEHTLRRMLRIGVDGIFTDNPLWARRMIEASECPPE